MRVSSTDQREGMGLLEYQSMPSLCDIAHDGVMSRPFSVQQRKLDASIDFMRGVTQV